MMFKRLRTRNCKINQTLHPAGKGTDSIHLYVTTIFYKAEARTASNVLFRIFVYPRELTRRQRPEHQVPDEDGPGVEDGHGGGGEPVAP